jgi:mannose-6-phosphate isomerase-like protein (cupin superfamily)
MKKGYKGSINLEVTGKTDFRRVLYTGEKMQLVAMTLQPGEDIGAEVHEGHDQFFQISSGVGEALVGETTYELSAGDMVIVPSGAHHNITNTSDTEVMELYTIYAPPEHADGTTHATKAIADEDDEHFDGKTTE